VTSLQRGLLEPNHVSPPRSGATQTLINGAPRRRFPLIVQPALTLRPEDGLPEEFAQHWLLVTVDFVSHGSSGRRRVMP
jgi:hypothetical protein